MTVLLSRDCRRFGLAGVANVFYGVSGEPNAYQAIPTVEQVDARFRDAQQLSTGGGDTVRLGGPNVEITDCDLYGSGLRTVPQPGSAVDASAAIRWSMAAGSGTASPGAMA